MSTKIYTAVKLPLSRMSPDFVTAFNERTLEYAKNRGLTWIRGFKPEVVSGVCDILREYHGNELSPEAYAESMDLKARVMVFIALAKRSSQSQFRSLTSVDAGFQFWVKGRDAYVIPLYYNNGLPNVEGSVDYSYWNNADRPQGVTSQEWSKRGKFWSKLNLPQKAGAHSEWETMGFTHHSILLKDEVGSLQLCERIAQELNPEGGIGDWENFAFCTMMGLASEVEQKILSYLDAIPSAE